MSVGMHARTCLVVIFVVFVSWVLLLWLVRGTLCHVIVNVVFGFRVLFLRFVAMCGIECVRFNDLTFTLFVKSWCTHVCVLFLFTAKTIFDNINMYEENSTPIPPSTAANTALQGLMRRLGGAALEELLPPQGGGAGAGGAGGNHNTADNYWINC